MKTFEEEEEVAAKEEKENTENLKKSAKGEFLDENYDEDLWEQVKSWTLPDNIDWSKGLCGRRENFLL